MPRSLIRGHLSEEPDCAPITTFYLTNEDEVADSSLKRFIRVGGDRSRFAYSGELQHHMTITEDELLSAIEETGCRLLIIDPFQAFLPEGTNMGSITKMRAIFTTLSNVAKMTNTAVVLVGHLNKNEGSKDIHRGFGSADIAASVRSILMVEMDKRDRERRWVRAIKSNFDESDQETLYTTAEEAAAFAEQSGCDSLAISIGTAHGVYKAKAIPEISFDSLAAIREATNIPLVLHGGSGSGDENLNKCARGGICKVNIYTDLYLSAMKALEEEDTSDYFKVRNAFQKGMNDCLAHYYKVFETKA